MAKKNKSNKKVVATKVKPKKVVAKAKKVAVKKPAKKKIEVKKQKPVKKKTTPVKVKIVAKKKAEGKKPVVVAKKQAPVVAPKKQAPVVAPKKQAPVVVPKKPKVAALTGILGAKIWKSKPGSDQEAPKPVRPKPSRRPSKKKVEGSSDEPAKPKKKSIPRHLIVEPKPAMFPKKQEMPKVTYPPIPAGKKQFKIEYNMRSSPQLLFTYLSTASGLTTWFSTDVHIRDGIFTFFWDGSSDKAKIIAIREDMLVAFQWIDQPDKPYFIFEVIQDDITGDVALIVTDFAFPGEVEQNKRLWDSQIHELAQVIGS